MRKGGVGTAPRGRILAEGAGAAFLVEYSGIRLCWPAAASAAAGLVWWWTGVQGGHCSSSGLLFAGPLFAAAAAGGGAGAVGMRLAFLPPPCGVIPKGRGRGRVALC